MRSKDLRFKDLPEEIEYQTDVNSMRLRENQQIEKSNNEITSGTNL